MSLIDGLRYRLAALFHRSRRARDLEREMHLHLELDAAQQERAAGGSLSRQDAWLAARRRFGNVTYLNEETRRMSALEWLDTIERDVRLTARSMRRTPGFTLIIILTLALGIGANASIYSLI